MVDILAKINTRRTAIALATLKVSTEETINAIKNNLVPKGNVFEMSKAAGLLAVKKTPDMIPDCHPLPIEYTRISHRINELEIEISVEVSTIYKTGVEVEAMHGAALTALTIYDMLKPIDKGITIEQIRLAEKKGGKTDFRKDHGNGLKAAVIIISDSIYHQKKEDKAGPVIKSVLEKNQLTVSGYATLPDNTEELLNKCNQFLEENTDLIIISGGTGLTPTDKTPEALSGYLDVEIPGIMEAARNYGQQRTPYSMFSRSIAGLKGNTLILAIPGSTNGATETMDALFPAVLHGFRMFRN